MKVSLSVIATSAGSNRRSKCGPLSISVISPNVSRIPTRGASKPLKFPITDPRSLAIIKRHRRHVASIRRVDGETRTAREAHPRIRTSAPVLAAAAAWADDCLQRDGSVFAEGESLWTAANLDELDRLFVQNYDEGEGSFFEKLDKQLKGGSASSQKLMAEALWLLMLFQSNVTPEKKRENICSVRGWSGVALDEGHPKLSELVLGGLGSPSVGYNTRRWGEAAYLLTLVRSFKRLDAEKRREILSDARRFSRWLTSVPLTGQRQFPHIIRHLLFPEEFESIASVHDKRAIVTGFKSITKSELKTGPLEGEHAPPAMSRARNLICSARLAPARHTGC